MKNLISQTSISLLLLNSFALLPNIAIADAAIEYQTNQDNQTLLVQDQKVLMQHGNNKSDMLYDAKKNSMTIIDHNNKSYSTIDHAKLKQLGEQISGIQTAISQQLANLPPEQRAQMEAFMKGMMQKQQPNQAAKVQYSLKEIGTDKTGNIACQKKQVFKDKQAAGHVCTANAKQLNISDSDYSALLKMQTFMIEAANTMKESAGSFINIDMPNLEDLKLAELMVYSEMDNDQHSTKLISINNSAIAQSIDIPSGYTFKEINSVQDFGK